eukprot:1996137-Amphidinium_carterae.1
MTLLKGIAAATRSVLVTLVGIIIRWETRQLGLTFGLYPSEAQVCLMFIDQSLLHSNSTCASRQHAATMLH